MARQVRLVGAWLGEARIGLARQVGRGVDRSGNARTGKAGQDWLVREWYRTATQVRSGKA